MYSKTFARFCEEVRLPEPLTPAPCLLGPLAWQAAAATALLLPEPLRCDVILGCGLLFSDIIWSSSGAPILLLRAMLFLLLLRRAGPFRTVGGLFYAAAAPPPRFELL